MYGVHSYILPIPDIRIYDAALTSGVFFLKSRLCSTSRFREISLSSWRLARSVAVMSSSFCNHKYKDKEIRTVVHEYYSIRARLCRSINICGSADSGMEAWNHSSVHIPPRRNHHYRQLCVGKSNDPGDYLQNSWYPLLYTWRVLVTGRQWWYCVSAALTRFRGKDSRRANGALNGDGSGHRRNGGAPIHLGQCQNAGEDHLPHRFIAYS